jgi:serine protease Do
MRPLVSVLFFACAASAVAATTRPATAPARSPFARAIAYAQERSVKIHGAGIALEHGYAAGTIVSADGLILTADGLIINTSNLRVTLPDGRIVGAKVVRRSEPLQSALLKVDVSTPSFFEMPDKSPVTKGDWVLAINNSFKVADGAEPLSVNMGIVSLVADVDAKRKVQDVPYDGDAILIDAITSNPGAPGGAVVTADGTLAGIVGRIMESKATNTRLNYAVPIERLRPFVLGQEMIVGPGTPKGKPFVGIRLFTLGGRKTPAYIDRIAPGSPAADAGLLKDDLVLAINGKAVRDCEDYQELEAALAPGAPATFTIKRKSQITQVKLSIREETAHATPTTAP